MTAAQILLLVWAGIALAICLFAAAASWPDRRDEGNAVFLGMMIGAGIAWPASLLGAACGYAVYRAAKRPRRRRC